MTTTDIKERAVLITLVCYLIFNYGFMQILVPGVGVPIGDLVLALFLATVTDVKWLQSFKRSVFILPFLIWWGLGLTRTALAVQGYGVWALRDASHVVESLFIWVGFVCAARPGFIDRLFRWMPWILVFVVIYSMGKPIEQTLQILSPKLTALAGYPSPIFFIYVNTAMLTLLAAAYLLLWDSRLSTTMRVVLAGVLIAYVAIFFQKRTNYVQTMVLVGALLVFRKELTGKLMAMAGAVIVLAGLMAAFDIRIVGAGLGKEFSIDFLGKHFMSIFGIADTGVGDAAQGVHERLEWWAHIWNRVTSSNVKILFGLGYGIPLTDFVIAGNIIVREPHNSFFSVFARIGLIGLIAFLWMQVNLFRNWWVGFRTARQHGDRITQNRYVLLLIYFGMVLVFAMGEDALEKPFNTISYYFFWGVILHYTLHLKRAAQGLELPGTAATERMTVPGETAKA
jgi:hypothetical protein